MLSEKMEKLFNEQINREYYSAYLYLSMGAYFESLNLTGFAQWMRAQTQEELFHGMRVYDHVNERGGRVVLRPIDGPKTDWSSPLDACECVCAHERLVSSWINDFLTAARNENDHASDIFLQWFVTEQVEEEQSASSITQQMKLIGDSANALLMLDRELGIRVLPCRSRQNSYGCCSSFRHGVLVNVCRKLYIIISRRDTLQPVPANPKN